MSITNAIIATNVGLYVWSMLTSFATNTRGGITEYEARLGIMRQFIDGGEWYRLISSGFLHFGLLHVAMNMFLLLQLGRMLEPQLGPTKFALIYFVSMLGGSAGALLLSPNAFTGGASGAVFGMMAAAVVGLRERGANPFRTGLGMTFAINIAFTLAIPGVSVGGHFGGALAGAVCGAVILAPAQWRLPVWTQTVIPLLVGVAAFFIAVTPSL
jgi:membrane associated rhomboid family serine protease